MPFCLLHGRVSKALRVFLRAFGQLSVTDFPFILAYLLEKIRLAQAQAGFLYLGNLQIDPVSTLIEHRIPVRQDIIAIVFDRIHKILDRTKSVRERNAAAKKPR